MNKKKIMQTSLKAVSQLAKKSTVKSANTACFLIQHQPKESEKIKKLRKFWLFRTPTYFADVYLQNF